MYSIKFPDDHVVVSQNIKLNLKILFIFVASFEYQQVPLANFTFEILINSLCKLFMKKNHSEQRDVRAALLHCTKNEVFH